MKIPEFKPSRRFLGEYDVPCLAAEVKNSQVGLATQRVAKFNNDPVFSVYLRGKKKGEISPWHQEKLEHLFVHGGIATALAEGIRELGGGYINEISEEDRQFFRQNGYSPYAHICELVIDEITRRVLFVIKMDLNDEHPATISLQKGHWRYEDYDYFLRYASAFEKHWIDKEAIKREKRQELWDSMFPPAKPDEPVATDCPFVYGQWVVDKRETSKLFELLEQNLFSVLEDDVYTIAEGTFKRTSAVASTLHGPIAGLERQGNWITVTVGSPSRLFRFWWTGTRLVDESGVVLRRGNLWERYFPVTNTEVRAASDLKWLAGDWWFSERKTTEVFKLLTNSEEELEQLKSDNASSPHGYQFVEGRRNLIVGGEIRSYVRITGCERCGNHYFLRLVVPGKTILTPEVWCDGEFLVERSGVAYERAAGSKPNK